MSDLFWPTLNLAALLALIVYFARSPFVAYVRGRHQTIGDELAQVRTFLAQAKEKHREFTRKLSTVEAEVRTLRQQALTDAGEAKARVLTEGKKLAANLVADARTSAEALYGDLRTRLYAELGTRVLDRAEAQLRERLTGDDRTRIQRDFSRQLGTVQ